MKQMIASLLTFILLFSAIPQTAYATAGNTPTHTIDGYVYTIDTENQTATIVEYTGEDISLTVPDSFDGYPVTTIGAKAFYKCQTLETVILPDSIKDIGYKAFAECSKLSRINFPLNWTNTSGLSERGNVFTKCPQLTSMVIPEGVIKIPAYAFASCTSLTEISLPSTLEIIGDSAFSNCSGLTSIHIPDSVTEIGANAFQGCKTLTDLRLPEGLLSIEKQAFYRCTSLETVILPDSIKAMGYKAFGECTNLHNINFPLNWTQDSGLDEDGTVFYGCDSLTEIIVPEGVTRLPVSAFSGCTGLTNISLPQTLKLIPSGTFTGCKALTHINIPDSVTSIGDSAFSNCDSLTDVYLPNSLETLGSNSFSNCEHLRYVTVPSKDTVFEKNIFKNTDDVTLVCPLHSMAAVYAIDNDMEFAADMFQTDTTGEALIRDESLYQASISSIYTNGYITFSLDYAIQEEAFTGMSFPEIIFKIPNGTTLEEETILADDTVCTIYNYNERNAILSIDLTQPSGNITFSTKAYELRDIQSYAYLEYRKDYEPIQEVIGIINESMELLSLYTEDITSSKELQVDGIAPASSTVELYLNNALIETVTANKVGSYQTAISLNPNSDFEIFLLEARTVGTNNELLSISKNITYRLEAPVLQEFTVRFGDSSDITYDLFNLGKEGIRPIIYATKVSRPATFTVKMSNASTIETLYVTSTRNNVKKSITAVYDANTDTFIATGYFDENDKGYIPGKLMVEYTLKPNDSAILSADGTIQQSILDACYRYQNKTEFTTTTTENGISGSIDLTGLLQETTGLPLSSDSTVSDGLVEVDVIAEFRKVFLNYAYETFETDTSTTSGLDIIERVYSYLVPCEDGQTYRLTVDCNDPTSWLLTLAEVSADGIAIVGDVKKIKFNAAYEDFLHNGKTYPADLAMLSDALEQRSQAADIITSSFRIVNDYHEMCNEINTSSQMILNPEKKALALKAAAEIRDDKLLLVLLTTALPALATGGASSVAGSLLSFLVGAMASTSDLFYSSRGYGISQYNSASFIINWAIDPSGYVYDNATAERLEGVTTTVYCIEYDESDTFWDNPPADNEYGTMWNSLEYSQQNPLITDEEGRYAWDVPEGWWRVKYEKEGYETIWSEWLPVPPPQTEVNIGMTPLELPSTPAPGTEPVVTPEPESTSATPEATDSDLSTDRRKAINRGNRDKNN